MSQTFVEKFTSTPEGMALFQQERTILEVTELICSLMSEQRVNKAALASRLGRSRAFVTQLLDGRANMTLRTLSDVLGALGKSLHFSAGERSLSSAPAVETNSVVFAFEPHGNGPMHFQDVSFDYSLPTRAKKPDFLRMPA